MYRNILKDLSEWKQSAHRKPLILMGARQVGKTWALKEFGRRYYKDTIYLNCDGNRQLEELFSDFDTKRILRGISAISGKNIDPAGTLVILDEIQEIPRALTALKYFAEKERELSIVSAGSLLGLSVHAGSGFPVGKVDMLNIYPMSFMEFLKAYGKDLLVESIEKESMNELNRLLPTLTDLLREYYFCGGMPEAVESYVTENDILRVRQIQKDILKGYDNDIGKHAPSSEIPKIKAVWNTIPSQLAKENKKFIYGHIRKGARAATYENAIMWLMDAGLIHKISNVRSMDRPLKFYEDLDTFKLFPLDIGLLGALSDTQAADILIGNNIFSEYKGSFTEAYVQQEMRAVGKNPIYYYSRENSTLKIDFVTEGNTVYPVEVKAETNLKAKSLSTVMRNNPDFHGIRFSMAPYKNQENMENIPLPLVEKCIESI